MKKKNKAFTLAEVLITLEDVGIVAALTIPSMVYDYQKQQYVTGLKKAYNQFNQALQLLTLNYNCIDNLQCTKLFNSTSASNFGDEIVKYFNVIKNCHTA